MSSRHIPTLNTRQGGAEGGGVGSHSPTFPADPCPPFQQDPHIQEEELGEWVSG